jgi:hypothetical protein
VKFEFLGFCVTPYPSPRPAMPRVRNMKILRHPSLSRQSSVLLHILPEQTPCRARTSVMDILANRPFMPPIGHRCRHQIRRSKMAEQMTAPDVMRMRRPPESAAWVLRCHTSSQTRMPAKRAKRNQGPHASAGRRKVVDLSRRALKKG